LPALYRRFVWWRKAGRWYRRAKGAGIEPRKDGMRAAIVLATLVIGLAGCVSAPDEAPDWADDGGYPSLREVPRGTSANTDAAYWTAVQADLTLAGEEVRNNPRSAPASETESPTEFLEQARRELEATRLSHESN